MLRSNSITEFKEELDWAGGRILWENEFISWTGEKQKEMISYLNGFIIYSQTDIGYLQPCWVSFEHDFSYVIQNFSVNVDKYYIKATGKYTHSVFKLYPRGIFSFLSKISKAVNVHKSFLEIPNYRLFHFLNKEEHAYFYKNEPKILEIIVRKMREAHLKEFVSTVKFVPEPKYYKL